MTSVDKIQRGLTRFIDEHIVPAFEAGQKVVVKGCATLITNKLPSVIDYYCNRMPLIQVLDVWDSEKNLLNIDDLYNAFVPNMGSEKIPIVLPVIGTLKIGKEDIDILIKYIRESQEDYEYY